MFYKTSMKVFLILINILLGIILLTGFYFLSNYIYKRAHYTHITATFDEAEPFSGRMKVFYRGFPIGKVVRVEPNSTYTNTNVKIVLFPKDLKIPSNVTVRVKSYKDTYNYIDIIAPDEASAEYLKNGDEVKGETAQNVNTFFNKHAEDGTLEILLQSVAGILDGVNNTVNETGLLMKDVRNTFQAASPNLVESSKNISTLSGNFSGTSVKLNNSVNQQTLDRTMNNLEQSSKNLENLTKNIDCATRNLTETMDKVYCITKDVNEITSGVNNNLQKPFGGARVIMGKSKPSPCCKNK